MTTWTSGALQWASDSQVDLDTIRDEAERIAAVRDGEVNMGVLQAVIGERERSGRRWRKEKDGESGGSGI